jgi:radical SAM protein with 4Fe4S-binding SPASM domain
MSLPEFPKISGGFRTMTVTEFKRICNDIKSSGKLKVLRFYLMGEPLLNPKLPEMIKIASKMGLAERTELTSNGSLLSEEKSKEIIYSGLDYFRISISSVDQLRHKRLTQTNIRIEQIYDNVKRFKEIRENLGNKKPFLYVKMLDSSNKKENSKFLRLYGAIADEVVIEKPMEWNSYGVHNLLKVVYKKKQAPNLNKTYLYRKSICPLPFYTLSISANGDVCVCCVDWNKATRVGNVFESSLKSIWGGPSLRDFYSLHISGRRVENPSCANCRFLYTVPDNLDYMSKSLINRLLTNC